MILDRFPSATKKVVHPGGIPAEIMQPNYWQKPADKHSFSVLILDDCISQLTRENTVSNFVAQLFHVNQSHCNLVIYILVQVCLIIIELIMFYFLLTSRTFQEELHLSEECSEMQPT